MNHLTIFLIIKILQTVYELICGQKDISHQDHEKILEKLEKIESELMKK